MVKGYEYMTHTKKSSNNDWNAKNYSQINLQVFKREKEAYKAHAYEQGESLRGFIKRSIEETIERDMRKRKHLPLRKMATEHINTHIITVPIDLTKHLKRMGSHESVAAFLVRAVRKTVNEDNCIHEKYLEIARISSDDEEEQNEIAIIIKSL